MLFLILFIIIFLYIIFMFFKLKIHIDFKSFFKRGFKKLDNKFGLFAYIGKQGKGKTYSAIKFVDEQSFKFGYTIITNIKSYSYKKGIIYEPDFKKIMELVNNTYKDIKYIILFDEIFTIIEKKTSLSREILSFISQLRKKKIIMVTTAQEWSEINITFRRYCRYQIDCNMFSLPFTHTAFIFNKINDGDKIKWSNDLQEFVAPTIASNFAKCEKRIIKLYDTFEVIKTY